MRMLAAIAVLFVSSVASNGTHAKDFVLGNVGAQRVSGVVPESWDAAPHGPPIEGVISARLSRGDPAQVAVLLTVARVPPESPLGKADARGVAQVIALYAEQAKPRAVETDPSIVPFTAGTIRGSTFTVTDKAPPPGEFKYMTQGVASLGEFLLTFTALSHTDAAEARNDTLAILSSLRVGAADPGATGSRSTAATRIAD